MSLRVIITGVDGFIGRNLKLTLENAGLAVSGISRRDADITDFERLLAHQQAADVLIHLAFPVSPEFRRDHPTESIRIATSGTVNAVMLARACQVDHFILASSGKVYGVLQNLPITEDHQTKPRTFLGRLKLLQEEIVAAGAENAGLFGCTLMRIFNVYGPDAPAGFLVPHLLAGLVQDQPISIGELDHKRDWLYIDDLCRAFATVIRKPIERASSRVLNVGSGKAASAKELIGILERTSQRRLETFTEADKLRPAEALEERADSSRLKSLGWKAEIDLASGLSTCFLRLASHEKSELGLPR